MARVSDRFDRKDHADTGRMISKREAEVFDAELAATKRELAEERWNARELKRTLAPDVCGGTDFWDAHTPEEVRAECVKRNNATTDAIVGITKRELAETKRLLDAYRTVSEIMLPVFNAAINTDEDTLTRAIDAFLARHEKGQP